MGDPPYCVEGVPGLGLPLMSAGSNGTLLGGGLAYSFDILETGEYDLVGECSREEARYGMYPEASDIGGGIVGASSSIEVPREGGLALFTGWYVRESGLGLSSFAGKPALLLPPSSPWKRTLIVVLRGLTAPSD